MTFFTRASQEGILTEASFTIDATSPLARHIPQLGDYEYSRIYLSPDDRVLFNFTFQAPPSLHDKLFPLFFGLAKSLQITKVDADRYWDQLARLRGWGTVDQGQFYENPALSVSCVAPDGWRMEILPTANRMNVALMREKGSRDAQMDVVVSDLTAPDQNLETLVDQRLEAFKSAGLEDVKVLKRTSRSLLGHPAVELHLALTNACGEYIYRIIYLRAQAQLYALTFKAISAEAADRFGRDFQDWTDSFEIGG
jgi:hypothetical protein